MMNVPNVAEDLLAMNCSYLTAERDDQARTFLSHSQEVTINRK